ncbi:MAG: hypothetical protein WBM86_00535 [Waterburya sp.]
MWAIDPKSGKKVEFFSRAEAKKKLNISEATFHKYINVLVVSWKDKFQYIPKQTHWSDYQVYCLNFVKRLFQTGRNESEVINYIKLYEIPAFEDHSSADDGIFSS